MIGPNIYIESSEHELVLARPELAHAVIMLTWASDKASMDALAAPDHEPLRDKATLGSEQNRIKEYETDSATINWAIMQDGRLVGNIWIDRDDEPDSGHLSYLIGDYSARGKGLAAKASTAVLEWAFNEGGFSILNAWCVADNIASRKTIERIGMSFAYRDINDELVNGVYPERLHYLITKREWKETHH